MVKDRLGEIRMFSELSLTGKESSIEIKANKNETQIEEILSQYTKIRGWMQNIRDNIEKMKSFIREMSQAFQRSSQKCLPENMEKVRLENMSLCQRVYTQMKDLEIDLPPKKDTTVIARIKRLHFYSVREEFINVWKQHEQFLIDYEEKIKRELQHQAKIIDANITDEETEALIANNTTSLFVGNILEQAEAERNKLRKLLVRHSELEKIERSIVEVRDMFLRISTLVMEQSPLLALVEYHAHQATLNTDKGATKLEKAGDLKIKRLKRKTWFLFWLAVVLGVFIVILLIDWH